ncbi:P-selectin isoform X2 [Parasteatoda tepidariorum]|uniref:P-selectin isoform X2 n=1 Tax=Parasteatoda tepidariorum TaxID=114398 RepID=UPI001C72534A|nr:P-selectin isoform X2 [Parasteatoda tepidariorum]
MDSTALLSSFITLFLFFEYGGGSNSCARNCNTRTCCDLGDSTCPSIYDAMDNGYTEGQCVPGVVSQSCYFRCNPGYVLEGQTRITCLPNGEWSSSIPYCTRRIGALCDPFLLPNGNVDCDNEGGLTVCRASCAYGYMLVGSSVITCSSSGEWSDQLPTCRRGTTEVTNICPTLNAPDGGRLVGSCVSANAGDTCQLVCISGYRPSDTRILICQTDGRWSNNLPRCISSGCPPVQVIRGILSGSCNAATTGQTCSVTCESGYSLSGTSTLVCQSNGEWSSVYPNCNAVQSRSCPALPSPANGGNSGSCNTGAVGQSCNFYCFPGFRLIGQPTLVCGSDGRWSDGPPQCIANPSCPSLNPPTNGGQSGNCRGATAGQSCSFSCQAGYILTGQSIIYCEADGRWSAVPPICSRETPASCPSLYTPSNGYMLGTCAPGRVGETCVFGCDENYVLRGQRTLTCEAGGRWSSALPRCDRIGTGELTGTCPILNPPPNGDFTECDNRPGGRCVLVCNPGYLRTGSRVRTCLSQGIWSGYAPLCTRRVGYTTTYTYKVVPLWSLVFG